MKATEVRSAPHAVLPLHILIVEDNPDGRESLRMLLQLYGYRVDVAEDGPRGVSVALECRPRVALVDIGLPGFDGFQVAHRLRAAFGDKIVLIACTANSAADNWEHARQVGFDGYLVKPLNLDELIHRLSQEAKGNTREPPAFSSS